MIEGLDVEIDLEMVVTDIVTHLELVIRCEPAIRRPRSVQSDLLENRFDDLELISLRLGFARRRR